MSRPYSHKPNTDPIRKYVDRSNYIKCSGIIDHKVPQHVTADTCYTCVNFKRCAGICKQIVHKEVTSDSCQHCKAIQFPPRKCHNYIKCYSYVNNPSKSETKCEQCYIKENSEDLHNKQLIDKYGPFNYDFAFAVEIEACVYYNKHGSEYSSLSEDRVINHTIFIPAHDMQILEYKNYFLGDALKIFNILKSVVIECHEFFRANYPYDDYIENKKKYDNIVDKLDITITAYKRIYNTYDIFNNWSDKIIRKITKYKNEVKIKIFSEGNKDLYYSSTSSELDAFDKLLMYIIDIVDVQLSINDMITLRCFRKHSMFEYFSTLCLRRVKFPNDGFRGFITDPVVKRIGIVSIKDITELTDHYILHSNKIK